MTRQHMTKQRVWRLGLIVPLVALADPNWAAASGDLPTYRAVYRVERDGQDSGASEWSLTYDAGRGVYSFVSSLVRQGGDAARAAVPDRRAGRVQVPRTARSCRRSFGTKTAAGRATTTSIPYSTGSGGSR